MRHPPHTSRPVRAALAASAVALALAGPASPVFSAQSAAQAPQKKAPKPATPQAPAPAPTSMDAGTVPAPTGAPASPGAAVPMSMEMQATPEGAAVKQATVDPALKARVDAYWGARMQMNLAAAYKFYDPTFRTAYSETQFLQNFQRLLRFRPEYLGIDSMALFPSGTVANVGVKLRTRPAELEGMELTSVSYEKWQKNGQTWFKQGESIMPNP